MAPVLSHYLKKQMLTKEKYFVDEKITGLQNQRLDLMQMTTALDSNPYSPALFGDISNVPLNMRGQIADTQSKFNNQFGINLNMPDIASLNENVESAKKVLDNISPEIKNLVAEITELKASQGGATNDGIAEKIAVKEAELDKALALQNKEQDQFNEAMQDRDSAITTINEAQQKYNEAKDELANFKLNGIHEFLGKSTQAIPLTPKGNLGNLPAVKADFKKRFETSIRAQEQQIDLELNKYQMLASTIDKRLEAENGALSQAVQGMNCGYGLAQR